MSVSLNVVLKLRFPEGKRKMDALKPLCGREGLVLSSDPSVMKTVCSLVCSFLQGGKKGAPAWLPAVPAAGTQPVLGEAVRRRATPVSSWYRNSRLLLACAGVRHCHSWRNQG